MSRAGSVKQFGTTWGFVVDVGRSAGRRQQVRKRGFRTKRDAQEALTETLATLQRGTFVWPRKMALATYLEGWMGALEIAGRRPTTIAGYGQLLRIHVIPSIGEIDLQELSALDLDALYGRLHAARRRGGRRPLGNRTIRYVHMVLGKALGDANARASYSATSRDSPLPHHRRRLGSPEMTVWTPEELRNFLESSASSPHGPLLRVAAMTGLRRAELCGLRWIDVDFDRSRLTVRQAITTVRHQPSLGDVKSTPRRLVDLDPITLRVLRAARARQQAERLQVGEGWNDTGLVFTMPEGAGSHPDVITRAFTRLPERTEFPRIRLHDLRHTHATHLLTAGTNVRVTSERLGHASVSFTLDVYGHVLPRQQADAAAAVSALVDL